MKKNKQKVVLFIDASDNRKVIVELTIGKRKTRLIKTANIWTSQILLPTIEDILRKNKVSLSDLTEIEVNKGPGSYTGTRVGVAVANTLAWFLHIPINRKKSKIVEPIYS